MIWALSATAFLALFFFILLFRQGASRTQWGRAGGQIIFLWVLSNTPIGLLLVESSLDPSSEGVFDLVSKEVRLGEAIVYLAAILAPVLYTLITNFIHAAKVYILTNIAGVFLCVVCASFIYARHVRDAPADADTLTTLTVTLYLLSIIFWYFSTVYELIVTNPDPGKSAKNRASEIEDELP